MVGLRRPNGQIIQLGDPIPTGELHYLRHVVQQQEWPAGTTQAQYEQGLRELAFSLRVGILVSEKALFGWQAAITGRSGTLWDSPLLDPSERQAFPLEWGNIIGRFARLEALARSGALKPESREGLRRVADWLAELLPTMRRLGVRLPDLEALERARRVEAA